MESGIKELEVKKSGLEKEVTEAEKSRDLALEQKRKATGGYELIPCCKARTT